MTLMFGKMQKIMFGPILNIILCLDADEDIINFSLVEQAFLLLTYITFHNSIPYIGNCMHKSTHTAK